MYDAAAQLSKEKEQEDLMNTSELHVTLCTPFEYKWTVKMFKKTHLNYHQNNIMYKPLENRLLTLHSVIENFNIRVIILLIAAIENRSVYVVYLLWY